MAEIGTDWRILDGVPTAWFDASSLTEGAALAGRLVDLSTEIAVDLRAAGVRVRLDSDEHAEAVSAAAQDLGLPANPAGLQHLSVVLESANPTAARRFWQRVLDYAPREDGGLADPLRRDPDTDPAVAAAAAASKPHPPRRGAAGRGGRAGESR